MSNRSKINKLGGLPADEMHESNLSTLLSTITMKMSDGEKINALIGCIQLVDK